MGKGAKLPFGEYPYTNDDKGRAQILAYIDGRLTDIRARLIERDLITPAGWGLIEFAQPYLGQYLLDRGRPQRIS